MRMRMLVALAALICIALSAGTATAASGTGTELEFAGDTAAFAAGQVSVPVECIGEPTGFCSGTLTVFAQGRKSVSTLSVEGGSNETIVVPLPAESRGRRTKVAALLTTAQPLGPPVTRKAILHLH